MKVSELLTNARARIANPLHWTQGVFATVRALDSHAPVSCTTPGDVFANVTKYGRDRVVRCCGAGAVLVELPPDDRGCRFGGDSLHARAMRALDAAALQVARDNSPNAPHGSYSLVMLNDSGLRGKADTHAAVLSAFDYAIAKAKQGEMREVQS